MSDSAALKDLRDRISKASKAMGTEVHEVQSEDGVVSLLDASGNLIAAMPERVWEHILKNPPASG